ncbi:MAG: hypothetical protein AAFV26_10520 [Pseudomonadota bacterium]
MQKPSQLDVRLIRREEKQTRLSEFIQQHLIGAAADASPGNRVEVVVVARTGQSPVVRALAAAIAAVPQVAVRISTVLTDAQGTAAPDDIASVGQIRIASDRKLLEAHEQIVIGETASWIGDCMRRDPDKLDAFERYVDDAAEAVSWARIAFDRLWDNAAPVRLVESHDEDGLPTLDITTLSPGVTAIDPSQVRH